MSFISRRRFLQISAGSTLTTLRLSHLNVDHWGNRYAQVLAQNTPRKLALLVGINTYPNNPRYSNLKGCVTDVNLQQELLIHRFGFNKSDIVRLTTDESPNRQPTRSNILTAFEEHLIKQAKPGDIVVFHFSGHGSRLRDPNPIQKCLNKPFNNVLNDTNSTLVIADEDQKGLAPDIMGRTLFLLISALNTENVTVVLDSCHSGGGTRGNFLVRSVSGENLNPSSEEIAYQKRWMKQLQLSTEELTRRRCASVAKGVVIASAQPDQEALDGSFGNFDAGVFTYLMTQYLWQQTDNAGGAIARITTSVKALTPNQVPLADGNQNEPTYFVNKKAPPTDAVIIEAKEAQATLWLGGLDYETFKAFDENATFVVVNEKGQTSGKLKLISRDGLKAEAKLVEKGDITSLKPGMLLQESSRVVPTDLKLSIGLDPSLASDTNAAKEAISAVYRVEAVSAQLENSQPYPKQVQYIFSRITKDYQLKLQLEQAASLPAIGSIGLFTQALQIVPESFDKPGEKVTQAVSRLETKLTSFLAAYVIKQTLNADSSSLEVEVSMNLEEKPNQILAKASTLRGKNNPQKSEPIYPHKLIPNKQFQFRATNRSEKNLYFVMLLIDYSGDINVIFPFSSFISNDMLQLASNTSRIIGDSQELILKATKKGSAEALSIFSTKPLDKSLRTLKALAAELENNRGPIKLKKPVDTIGNLLVDLSGERDGISQASEVNASEIATLSINFEVN